MEVPRQSERRRAVRLRDRQPAENAAAPLHPHSSARRRGRAGTARLPLNRCLVGDAATRLLELPPASVDCVVTSPPYYLLRQYGMPGQIGLEATVDAWTNRLADVMEAVQHVLKPGGSLWLNVGDSYSRHDRYGAPRKGLLMAPERLILRLAADGWTVRNKVVWAKTNPRPASVGDRLSCTWEAMYFLTRSPAYYFDLDAIRVPHRTATRPGTGQTVTMTQPPPWAGPLAGTQAGLRRLRAGGRVGHPLGKNPGDVWQMPSSNYRGAHFATFPEALVERPLLATCPEAVCAACGRPWKRRAAEGLGEIAVRGALRAECGCRAARRPGLVLDPFFGAGTVGVVAERLGRDWIGIELNPAFAALADQRLARHQADAA